MRALAFENAGLKCSFHNSIPDKQGRQASDKLDVTERRSPARKKAGYSM